PSLVGVKLYDLEKRLTATTSVQGLSEAMADYFPWPKDTEKAAEVLSTLSALCRIAIKYEGSARVLLLLSMAWTLEPVSSPQPANSGLIQVDFGWLSREAKRSELFKAIAERPRGHPRGEWNFDYLLAKFRNN